MAPVDPAGRGDNGKSVTQLSTLVSLELHPQAVWQVYWKASKGETLEQQFVYKQNQQINIVDVIVNKHTHLFYMTRKQHRDSTKAGKWLIRVT